MSHDNGAMQRALLVVMFVGAAANDATPVQRDALKDLVPVLRDASIPAGEAYSEVVLGTCRVMGPEWAPTGEWEDWIMQLVGASHG